MNNLSNYVSARLQSNVYGERSIEIYGGAYFIAKNMDNGINNLEDIILAITGAVKNAALFAPKCKHSDVAKNFCHLLLIDPKLIEVGLGVKLTELDKERD